MSYEPTNWKKGDKITSARLNKIENGIQGNDSEISDLKSGLSDIDTLNTDLFTYASWMTGGVNPTTGSDASSSVRLRTDYIDLIGIESFITQVESGYKYCGYLINADKTAVVHTIAWTTGVIAVDMTDHPTAASVRFVLQKTDNTLPESGSYLTGRFRTNLIDAINSKVGGENIQLELYDTDLVSGSLQAQSMTVSANPACVSYLTKIPVNGGEQIKIEPPEVAGVDHYTYRFGFYDSNGTYLSQIATTADPVCNTTSAHSYISFMCVAYDANNAQVAFNVLNSYTANDKINVVFLDRWISVDELALKSWVETFFEPGGRGGHMTNAVNINKNVNSARLGALQYPQSFCVYDNKYYSIDGDNIAEQDANFNVLRDTTLSTGHGNSLQLGHNGKAYASGWNDQKIYVIDLASLSVTNTITIPITGYFSAVVDDLNNIVYILHRATYPDTIDHYTFSIYDITNATMISSRIVNAFGALQGMDYVDGKIIAAYGLGTQAVPNGVAVYNSIGDIIGSFDLQIFSITEIEGIAFNRNGEGVYISLWNKSVYLIN